jgi:hypothetical protein
MREPSRMGEDGGTGVLKENSLTQHSRGQILGMLRLRAGSSFAGTRSPDCAKTNSATAQVCQDAQSRIRAMRPLQ